MSHIREKMLVRYQSAKQISPFYLFYVSNCMCSFHIFTLKIDIVNLPEIFGNTFKKHLSQTLKSNSGSTGIFKCFFLICFKCYRNWIVPIISNRAIFFLRKIIKKNKITKYWINVLSFKYTFLQYSEVCIYLHATQLKNKIKNNAFMHF